MLAICTPIAFPRSKVEIKMNHVCRMLVAKIRSAHCGDTITLAHKGWYLSWTVRTEIGLTKPGKNFTGLSTIVKWEMLLSSFSQTNKTSRMVSFYQTCLRHQQHCLLTTTPMFIAMKPHEIQEKLGLTRIRDRNWYVQPACATTGDGLYEGLTWLTSNHKS